MKNDLLNRLSPGMRTIKTALAIIVCLVAYYFGEKIGIANTSDAFLACVAAIISMRDTVEKSFDIGFHRLAGTLVGAILGLLYSLLFPFYESVFLGMFLTVLGVVLLITLCDVLKIQDAIAIACVVFLFIAMQQSDMSPLELSIRRFADTAVGILISLAINHFISRPDSPPDED